MTTTASYPQDHHLANGYSPSTSAYTNGHGSSMDGRQGEYAQSGLSSPYQQQQLYGEQHSEGSADATSASQYTPGQDVKYNPSATPTSEYGLNPSPARPAQYQDYMQRSQFPDGAQRYHHNAAAHATQPAGPGQMPQATSPSTSTPNDAPIGDVSDVSELPSNMDMTLDPTIAVAPPAYPQQYNPYPSQHEAPHYTPQQHMYPPHQYGAQYPGAPHAIPAGYGHIPPPPMHASQAMVAGPRPPGGGHLNASTVYSFVPIPGTHQQKRPRRRFEEIERMYKCGWQGCEKAYGTLNHLNAHVTMQSHGQKRTPEEFKEIRKEWKQRKKEEDTQRKAEDERQRQHQAAAAAAVASGQQPVLQVDGAVGHDGTPSSAGGYAAPSSAGGYAAPSSAGGYAPQQVRQLPPPMGYAPAGGVASPYVGQSPSIEGMPHYHGVGAQMAGYYPHSPYGGSSGMYQSSENGSTNGQVHGA